MGSNETQGKGWLLEDFSLDYYNGDKKRYFYPLSYHYWSAIIPYIMTDSDSRMISFEVIMPLKLKSTIVRCVALSRLVIRENEWRVWTKETSHLHLIPIVQKANYDNDIAF